MDKIELYWAIVSHSTVVVNYILEGWLFYRFVKPFMKSKPHYVGICYSAVMLLFFCVPQQITYPNLHGALAAWVVMCILEKRKINKSIDKYSNIQPMNTIKTTISIIFSVITAIGLRVPAIPKIIKILKILEIIITIPYALIFFYYI